MNSSDIYGYDPAHPVPDLSAIDVNTVKIGGGSDLFIVIAEPLQGDRRSLERLLRKIEVYLEFLATDDFQSRSGQARCDNTNIIVKIHPNSDPLAFELLERNKQWAANNFATLVVDTNI